MNTSARYFRDMPKHYLDDHHLTRSTRVMDTVTPSADAISSFNQRLAVAKLGALELLQNLIAGLTDPEAPLAPSLRELRLLATAILRTQPMKHAPARDEPAAPPTSSSPPPREASDTPAGLPASPPPAAIDRGSDLTAFNPVRRAAIKDVRALLRAGNQPIIRVLAESSRLSARAAPS